MIGHNLMFDKGMMINELRRINKQYNFPWPINNTCTVEEIVKVKGHRMRLGDLYEDFFNERFDSAHTAEADTTALLRIFKEMVNRNMVKL